MSSLHCSASGVRRVRILLVGMMAGGAAFGAAPAPAGTAITATPVVITRPGSYVLKQSLDASGDGIIIRASGVRLNLGGNTLTGPNDGTGVGIWVAGTPAAPLKNVHINGGVVQGFGVGVGVENASRCHINGLVCQENVSGALPGDGIQFVNSQQNRINGSTFTRNRAFGVRLVNADNNRFNGNEVTSNVGPLRQGGLLLVEGSTGNRIIGCNVSGNGEVGVSLADATSGGNLIQGCVIRENDVLPDSSQAGILVVSSGNKIRSNEVSVNRVGISVSFNARSNLIQSNTALDNRIRDLQDFNLPQCLNTWKSNSFVVDNEPPGDFGPKAGCIQ